MKIIYCLLFCLISTLVSAQEQKKHLLHWGLAAGIETQTLGIEPLDEKVPEETAVVAGRNKPGATCGIACEKKIWRGLFFQSGLSLSYNYNKVEFRPSGQNRFEFTDLELPVYFTFVNQKNSGLPVRGKLLLGARSSWNLANNSRERLSFLKERLAIDLGLGAEIKLGKLRIVPEAIYSHGLNNLHDFTGTDFDFLVGRAVRDKLAFRVLLFRSK